MAAADRRTPLPHYFHLPVSDRALVVLVVVQSGLMLLLAGGGLFESANLSPVWVAALLTLSACAGVLALAAAVRLLRRHHVMSAGPGLSELLAMQEAVISGADSAILVVDESGRIELANPALERLSGRPSDALVGRRIQTILKSEASDSAVSALLDSAMAEGTAHGELVLDAAAGTSRPLLLSVRFLGRRSDDLGRFVLVGIDLTARKEAERLRAEFVSMVSHELRTPLTSIHGAVELICEAPPQSDVASVLSMAEIARASSARLIHLINDLLDLDRVDSGNLHLDLKVMDVRDAVQQAAQSARVYIQKLGGDLDLQLEPSPAPARVDVERLIQVLLNLLSNAAKFGGEGDRVQLRLFSAGGRVCIEVEDHGPGIPESLRGRLFDRFVQGDQQGRRKGSGLGLAISRALVLRMGGELNFRTELGVGTCFQLSFPVAEDPGFQPGTESTIRRLLLCDADAARESAIRSAAAAQGVAVVAASSCDAAMKILDDPTLDAVAVDAELPGGNVVQLLRQIRDCRGVGFPVYLLGQRPQPESRVADFVTRAVTWLETPEDEAALLRSLAGRRHDANAVQHILHIEDDAHCRELVKAILAQRADVDGVASLAEARKRLTQRQYDAVLLDRMLPDGDGHELLSLISRTQPKATCVMLSAYAGGGDTGGFVTQVLDKGAPYAQSLQRVLWPGQGVGASQEEGAGNA